jgi:hypothetical protein
MSDSANLQSLTGTKHAYIRDGTSHVGCYLAPPMTAGEHYDRADPCSLCHRSRGTSRRTSPCRIERLTGGPPARLGYREGVARERKPRPGPVRKTLPSTP